MRRTLPLAAIFTPGTLTVQSEVHTLFSDITVPERHLSDVSFYAATLHVNESTTYRGMSVETTRNVGRVQLANALLPLPRPDTNVTYTTSFAGPALTCSRMEAADVDLIGDALNGLLESTFIYHGHAFSNSQIVYFGWVPQTEPNLNEANTTFFEQLIDEGNSASSANLDYVSQDAARIYVYLNTSGLTQDSDDDGQFKRIPDTSSTPAAMVTCKLYNASYEVHFDVRTTGEQSISASTTFLNWQKTQSKISDNSSSLGAFSTQALMEAFGWTFTQFIYVLPPSNGSATIYGTHALEMNPALLPVQSDVDASDSADYMMHQMEDFFQNMTLGLRYADLPNHSDNSSLTSVNATSKFFRADYVYEPEALIIAYAISNIISLLCVMIGVFAIYQNGASFTNYFSTIVRVTNHLDLEESIDEKDRSGADPLPSQLASTVVGLGQQREQVKQEVPKRSASWSWNEHAVSDDPDWQTATLRGMGLR
ncbi:hypothetical protein H2200_001999 [Cladophialophora chaetospira]|uniref:Transmembrane protein n=1 Tax=Cladophialophora chaetospira TaxID=386627 RepID=A0AA39CQ71_9EURO|nr:hypothetical protein H2200_001999 [Cladophialophora chaetospira]